MSAMSSYVLVFMTGLFSAAHCIGMCGGIVTAVTLQSPLSAKATTMYYHLGRAFSYTLFGIGLGAVGSFLEVAGKLAGMKGIASIIGGCFLLLWVWRKFQVKALEIVASRLHRILFNGVNKMNGGHQLYIIATGVAFGFLPCGLTYAMGMQAASTGNGWAGGLTMLVFAAGTFPALAITASLSALASKRWRGLVRKLGTWTAIIIGILSILRGLAANGVIPTIHHWLW